MKQQHYINCSTEQLIRSARDEEYYRSKNKSIDPGRFVSRSPSEIKHVLTPEDLSLPYPLLISLFLEGQVVREVSLEIGWQHQALEKSLEQVNWAQATQLLGRIETKADRSISMAYQLGIEKLFKVSVAECQRYLRIVRLETQRIMSHVIVINRSCEVLGEARRHAFMQKATSNCERFGAIVSRVPNKEALANEVDSAFAELRATICNYVGEIRRNERIYASLDKKSVINLQSAMNLGLTGIYLRSAGSFDDLRASSKEFPYTQLKFQSMSIKGGDAYSRMQLRLLEIENSLELIAHGLENYRGHCVDIDLHGSKGVAFEGQALPKGVVTTHIEGAEGEVAVTICSNGSEYPYRVRIKTPSFSISSAISSFLSGCQLDEVVLLLSTLGINTLHTDR